MCFSFIKYGNWFYNKPKELPSFLQVKLMPILKLRVLIKDQHFKIQNLKLIQDNLKKFWY